MHFPTDRTAHTTAVDVPVVDRWSQRCFPPLIKPMAHSSFSEISTITTIKTPLTPPRCLQLLKVPCFNLRCGSPSTPNFNHRSLGVDHRLSSTLPLSQCLQLTSILAPSPSCGCGWFCCCYYLFLSHLFVPVLLRAALLVDRRANHIWQLTKCVFLLKSIYSIGPDLPLST